MAKKNYYRQAIKMLEELNKNYPTHTLGMHISTALDGYGDYWGISDKEFCFAIEKYIAELELNGELIASDTYVNRIVDDAANLFEQSFDEEEEDEDGY